MDHRICIHFQKYPGTPGKGLFFLGLKILKVSQTSHRDAGLAPKSENHSLGPLPCSRDLLFSYPECKAPGQKGSRVLIMFPNSLQSGGLPKDEEGSQLIWD